MSSQSLHLASDLSLRLLAPSFADAVNIAAFRVCICGTTRAAAMMDMHKALYWKGTLRHFPISVSKSSRLHWAGVQQLRRAWPSYTLPLNTRYALLSPPAHLGLCMLYLNSTKQVRWPCSAQVHCLFCMLMLYIGWYCTLSCVCVCRTRAHALQCRPSQVDNKKQH